MASPISRRSFLKAQLTQATALSVGQAHASEQAQGKLHRSDGRVLGSLTGAQALVEALLLEGTECIFGIPGAQQNELWDTMKQKRLRYFLVTHEFSASVMADGHARATGKPGVLAVVPGPGLTNALSGIGEALLDSIPLVCIVGDVARGKRYRPFQVHDFPQADLLRPVTKEVLEVTSTSEISVAVRRAFLLASSGEPGPVAVIVPYDLLFEQVKLTQCRHDGEPTEPPVLPLDESATEQALALLADPKLRVGIHAGLGCMDYSSSLVQLAEILQAPVSTSISGKGVISEDHPLAVGWGYGPQGTRVAEKIFGNLDLVLAIGVRYSEISTGFYSIPEHRHRIHVDINPDNLGRIVRADVKVHADAGVFLGWMLGHADLLRRCNNKKLLRRINELKKDEKEKNSKIFAKCGTDPMAFLRTLRRLSQDDAQLFIDVSLTEHWAAEVFTTRLPRTYFGPTNNQAMGWSIPAAIGAQVAYPNRQTLVIIGDGSFLMSAMEISSAVRECLPVKFFVLDDQAYGYMQRLQEPLYQRTTATELARLDFVAIAQGLGVGYNEILATDDLEPRIRGSLGQDGPVLTRVLVDYRKRPVRWIEAVADRFTDGLSTGQKVRFLARIGSRTLDFSPRND